MVCGRHSCYTCTCTAHPLTPPELGFMCPTRCCVCGQQPVMPPEVGESQVNAQQVNHRMHRPHEQPGALWCTYTHIRMSIRPGLGVDDPRIQARTNSTECWPWCITACLKRSCPITRRRASDVAQRVNKRIEWAKHLQARCIIFQGPSGSCLLVLGLQHAQWEHVIAPISSAGSVCCTPGAMQCRGSLQQVAVTP